MMKRILILTMVLLPLAASAEPASKVAWTPETLNRVKSGKVKAGEEQAVSCQGCHGEKGEGTGTAPVLAGQTATYLYKQLRDYSEGSREDAMMGGVAKGLTEQQSADLAAWFSSLATPKAEASAEALAKAKTLVEDGDGKRILPPCFVCHGSQGQGEKMDIPALAGQQADYLARSLQAYKTGVRKNDIYSRMRLIAQQLSDEEIEQLGRYYQGMGSTKAP